MGEDIDGLMRRGKRDELQDGFTEISMGLFAFLAGVWAYVGRLAPEEWLVGLMLLFLLAGAGSVRLLMVVRSRVAHSRLAHSGYVTAPVRNRDRLTVLAAAALLALAAGILGSGGLEIWIPSLLGLGVAAPFLRIAYETGLARLYALAVISTLIPVGLALADLDWLAGLAAYLALMGIVLALSGTLVMLAYLKQNPLGAEDDG